MNTLTRGLSDLHESRGEWGAEAGRRAPACLCAYRRAAALHSRLACDPRPVLVPNACSLLAEHAGCAMVAAASAPAKLGAARPGLGHSPGLGVYVCSRCEQPAHAPAPALRAKQPACSTLLLASHTPPLWAVALRTEHGRLVVGGCQQQLLTTLVGLFSLCKAHDCQPPRVIMYRGGTWHGSCSLCRMLRLCCTRRSCCFGALHIHNALP